MLVVREKTSPNDIHRDGGTTINGDRKCMMLPIFVSCEQAEDVNKCCTGFYVVYCLF